MAALVARFVDAIASSRQVRLNINDGSMWRLQADTRLDPPKAKRARVSTLLTEGAIYPASAYDDRVLELSLLLETLDVNQAAEQIQKLVRELDRPGGNILEYQPPAATHPVFFRTIRLGIENIDMPTDGTQHWLRVPIIAEPFAYGLREDPVSGVTVNFNPAAGSNGGFFDIAAASIKGDVETPVKIIFPSSLAVNNQASLLAVRRRGTPANTPFLLQAESMTVGTDTSTQANDALFSGSSNNWTRTTFATTAPLTTRLTMATHPASPSVDARGTYRLFARMRKTVSGDTITVQATVGGAVTDAGTVTMPSGTNIVMIDLGLCSIPASQDPIVDMVTGTEIAAVGVEVRLAIGRGGGGSGNADVDYLVFYPADDRLCYILWGGSAPPTDFALDGFNEVIYGRDASGRVATVQLDSTFIGGAPMLTPNRDHRIYFLYCANSAVGTTLSTTTSISLSYFPRYLAVRPASS